MHRTLDARTSRRSLILRTIYALCLLGATYNHWYAIFHHGLHWDYGGFPKASATFWTALAFIDPVAVILLFARHNVGIALTVGIIVTDVVHNVWTQARYFPPLLQSLAQSPQVIEQIAFMVFVLVSSPFAWAMQRQTAA
ncbi:MAG: hypothetical protein EOO77_11710 [Oxalobacteraceae bacterium]|nr:MAG: hypothetical protein EOO77_11710 [Oxalobacteraceae bacterium]